MIDEIRIRKYFVDYITKCMTEKDLRPWYVAYYSEIYESTMRDYMKGIRLPRPITLIMMAELLECSVNELLGYGYFERQQRERPFDSGFDTRRVTEYFINKIIFLMKEKHIGINDLSRKSGINEYTLANYLRYSSLPETSTILKICDALDCTPSDLLGY